MAGSDKRGTAYGVLELSRMMGVSPWEWWTDAVPEKRGILFACRFPETGLSSGSLSGNIY